MPRKKFIVVGSVTPTELKERKNEFGGMNIELATSIARCEYTVDLEQEDSGVHVGLRVLEDQFIKIMAVGALEVESDRWWSNSNDPRIHWFLPGTDEEIERAAVPFE